MVNVTLMTLCKHLGAAKKIHPLCLGMLVRDITVVGTAMYTIQYM